MQRENKTWLTVRWITLFFLWAISQVATQSCSTGMRKIYIDSTNVNIKGSARRVPLSIAYYEGAGAIWFNRKILIEPRMEIHIKVYMNNLQKDQEPLKQVLDGFTIILSKTTNFIGTNGGYLGYNGLTNSYIFEADYYQNPWDASSNTASIHKCFGSTVCGPTETGTKQINLSNQWYNPKLEMNFDYRMVYTDGEVNIFSGDQKIITEKIDLISQFGDNIVYVGFTGFFTGNRKELNMLGSFICEDTYDITKTTGYFLVNGVKFTELTIKAGTTFRFIFSFINKKSQVIPHTYGLGIWTYTIRIGIECATPTAIGAEDKYYFYLNTTPCETVGRYYIKIVSDQKGECPNIYWNVIPNDWAIITYIGHNGGQDPNSVEMDSSLNSNRLTYGTANDKNFIISAGKIFILDFKLTDRYGNIVDLGTTDSATILSKSGLSVKSSNSFTVTMNKNGENYQMKITIQSPGTYLIPATSFWKVGYHFIVQPGIPNSTKSSCTWDKYTTTPILKTNTPVTYTCTLRDQDGNSIPASKLSTLYSYNTECSLTHQVTASTTSTFASTISGDTIVCKTTPVKMGDYSIYLSFWPTGTTTKTKVPATVNTFSVHPIPTGFTSMKLYGMSTKTWGTSATLIHANDNTGLLFAIDLTDVDGISLISTYKYHSEFAPATIKAIFSSPHDTRINQTLTPKYLFWSNKPYIGMYFGSGTATDNFVKKSSYSYSVKLTLGTATFTVTITNSVTGIGNYKTCTHDLSPANTVVTSNKDNFNLLAGEEKSIGELLLQTTDSHLYIAGISPSDITTTITPSDSTTSVKITQDSSLLGKYNISFTSKIVNNYTVKISIKTIKVFEAVIIVNPSLAYSFEIPDTSIYTVSETQYTFKTTFTTDQTPTMPFIVKDKNKNQLKNPWDANNNGMEFSVSANGALVSTSGALVVEYDSSKGYQAVEHHKAWGKFVVNIRAKESGKSISFVYTKIPGSVSYTKSNMVWVTSGIIINSISFVEVEFNDASGLSLGNDDELFDQARKSTTVTATGNIGGKKYTYTYSKKTTSNKAEFQAKIDVADNYKVVGLYNSQSIPCAQCQLAVTYDSFDIKKSQMNVLLDVMVEISENSELNIQNAFQRPIYKLIFKNADGKSLEYIDPNTNIKVTMTGDNFETELWITKATNFITMKYEDSLKFPDLVSGSYKLNVLLDEKVELIYPLKLLGDGEDSDAGNGDYDLSKTNFSTTIINGVAGWTYNINIEFRTDQNKRWNNNGDASLFTFTNSLGLQSSKITITSARGGKKGQFIVSIIQTQSTETNAPNKITLKYDKDTIPQQISVNIKNADLASLVIDPECVSSNTELKPGTVLSIPNLLFTPYDKYGNVYTDLFDSKVFTSERWSTLINVSHSGSGAVTQTATVVTASHKLQIALISRMKGTLSISSALIVNKIYTIKVANGPLDPAVTTARLTGATEGIAGTEFTFIIDPRDKYSNTWDDLTSASVSEFGVTVNNPRAGLTNITTGVVKTNLIEYKMKLTEAGNILITPKHIKTNVNINCSSCAVKVKIAAFEFMKTIVTINGNTLSSESTYQLDTNSSPTFIVSYFDNYQNQITDIANIKLTATFTGNNSDISICNENSNSNKLIFLCRTTENTNKWFFWVNGEGYKLTIFNDSKSIVYPLELIGSNNSDGSNGPVDWTKTEFSRTSITKLAGEVGSFTIELKTEDWKRKNFWYTDPAKEIIVSFQKDSTTCTSQVVIAEKPGQYTITVQCTVSAPAKSPNTISLTIEGTKLEKTVALIVNPNEAVIGYFTDSWGSKINQGSFPKANADENYTLKLNLYDAFNNLANEDVGKVAYTIQPPSSNGDSNISNTISKNSDNTFKIVIKPIYMGTYGIASRLFETTYTFDTEPGVVVGQNSLMLTVETATAGETVKAYIIPHDKNNNYVDPVKYTDVTGNSFIVNYKYKVDSENYSAYQALTTNTIEAYAFNGKNYNVFAYPNKLIHRYTNFYRATWKNTELKCLQCLTEVAPGPLHFPNSLLLGFSTSLGQFVEINDQTVEDNTKNDIIYRIYPRDEFSNIIDIITNFDKYSVIWENSIKYPLKIANKDDGKQSYIEFEKNDPPSLDYSYNTLIGGIYTCTFSNGVDKIVKNIKLAGSPGDEFASNQETDLQQTHINSMNLNYVAGHSGEMFIEIRTINGWRKKTNQDFKFRIVNCYSASEDPSFTFTSEKSGTLGVFYITVKSTKANTYPTLKECLYTIYIDDVWIKPLKPATQVSPNVISYTLPKKEYIKDDTTLLEGNADTTYKFTMITYDKFGNVNQGNQNTIKLSIHAYINGSKVATTISFTSQVNTSTGEIDYLVNNKKSGTYNLSSATNPSGGKNYLEKAYSFTIVHGAIAPENTIIKVETTSILAGETASISLVPVDKNNNPIPLAEATGKFVVMTTENWAQPKTAKETIDKDKLVFSNILTVAGEAKWTIKYNTEDISNNGAYKTEVKPNVPEANNSIISVKNSLDVLVQYKNNDNIPANTKTPIEFYIQLRDSYNNTIKEIDPKEVTILNAVMKGNDMEEIKMTISYPSKDTILLAIPEDKKYEFNRWVASNDYTVSFTLKTNTNQADYKFPINLTSDRDTEGYGNGPYVPDNSKIEPTNLTIYAGDSSYINLKLFTEKNLMYNDDIDLAKDIDYSLSQADSTFTLNVMKVSPDVYADYNVHIFSTKAINNNIITLKLKDPKTGTMVALKKEIKLTVLPGRLPDPTNTIIISRPNDQINSGDSIEIKFQLYDKYKNLFIGVTDIINNRELTLIHNNEQFENTIISWESNDIYVITYKPNYPPRDCVINVILKRDGKSVIVFPENITTQIFTDTNWKNTEIVTNNASSMVAGNKLIMSAYIYDSWYVCIDTDYPEGTLKVEVSGPLEDVFQKKTYKYNFVKVKDEWWKCQNRYDIVVADDNIYTTAGTYSIIVKGGNDEIKRYTQTVTHAGYDKDKFKAEYTAGQNINPSNVLTSETLKFKVTGKDKFGNDVNDVLGGDFFASLMQDGKEAVSNSYKIEFKEKDDGVLDFELTIFATGLYNVKYHYKNEELKTIDNSNGPSELYVVAGTCSHQYPSVNTSAWDKITLAVPTTVTISCYDKYNNVVNKGGNDLVAIITLTVGETTTNVKSTIKDNNNGKYDITFSPPLAGDYTMVIYLDGVSYGDIIKFVVKTNSCEEDTPWRCPNIDKCVSDPFDCIDPPNGCDKSTPFKCKVNGVATCVKSQNDCDCPEGFMKCTDFSTHYCVPEGDQHMCPFSLPLACKKYSPSIFFCPEGNCQLNEGLCSSPRVCPIGKVLCGDLTCRNSYSECIVYPDCANNQVRCLDQSCMANQFNCPSTISCNSPGKVVCPDGSCVDNEIKCKSWTKCIEPNSFLCPNNSCVANVNDCPKSISCGNGLVLCADHICRSVC